MFCPGCGKQATENTACECGYVAPKAQVSANDLVNLATSKFSLNALISFAAGLLLLPVYFFPWVTIPPAPRSDRFISGWRMIFPESAIEGPGRFGYFWLMILPMLAMVVCALLLKGDKQKNFCLSAAIAGLLFPLSWLFYSVSSRGTTIVSAGAGVYIAFLLWGVMAAAWLLEVLNIDIFGTKK